VNVVVITGSRSWPDRAAIERALTGAELLIIGDCPTGADAIALAVAKEWDIIAAVFVADWKRYPVRNPDGSRNSENAGPRRNKEIADRAFLERQQGMDVKCYAFPIPGSIGTYDCKARLVAAGFEVRMVTDAKKPPTDAVSHADGGS
jgi:hypothetical protein